jgi:hypothetical protein
MGLLCERSPLGEIKGKKKKKKKGERGGGAMGPRAHEAPPSPLWPATPLGKGTLVPHCQGVGVDSLPSPYI